jgi:hypothetical protein
VPAGLWQKGTIIYADSTAGTSGRSSFTRRSARRTCAYVQGQDDAGHAALSN